APDAPARWTSCWRRSRRRGGGLRGGEAGGARAGGAGCGGPRARGGRRESAVAAGAAGVRRLWRCRDAAGEAVNAVGVPHKLDVAVPLEGIPEFVSRVRAAVSAAAPQARLAIWGPGGGGT